MRRTKEAAENTRKRIMEGALDLFIEKGFSNTSLTEIAHCLGITKGVVYWHFKNKEDILLQIVKRHCEAKIQEAVNALSDPMPEQTLYSFYKKSLNCFTSDERFIRVYNLLSQNHSWPEDIRNRVFDMLHDAGLKERGIVTAHIKKAQEAGAIRGDIEAEKIAVVITSVFNGLYMLQTKDLLPPEFFMYDKLIFEPFSQTLASLNL